MRIAVSVVPTITLLLHVVFCTSDFEVLKSDSIFDGGTQGNKAFLKSRLLENLNNFFPSINNEERLEMLTESKSKLKGKKQYLEENVDNQDLIENTITDPPSSDFPTLIPFSPASDSHEAIILTTTTMPKTRKEGKINSEANIDSIREWRRRLYKAFKNRSKVSRIMRKSPSKEVVEMNDDSPIIMDKNRQIILSRTEPNWQSLFSERHIQTYGRDLNGKLIPLFGIEPGTAFPNDRSTIEPYPPREIRYSYRTANREPSVYVPASQAIQKVVHNPLAQNTIPVAASPSTLPIQLHILPPIQSSQIVHQQTTPSPQLFAFSTFAPNSVENQSMNECSNGQCNPDSDEDKCNSQRLRTIIFDNIVNGDAEASKKAVQSAAESETGLFFDAVCGTGFFSYIAHTDEFCLASSGGVNCYVFAPICQPTDKHKKKMTKLSKN
ncbi:CBN-GRL-14 protein [Caenorhabditis brenneri]|uniref:CBN-GRL-14 protein n=1 Tax=Caenorhabditis brenneri TaxID=135651 RepID=G0NKP1_CAEBE|nr:CBN-GRL-14 protein [Caenorhabditis brenneri]